MNQGRRKVLYLITKATTGGAQKYVFDLATNLPDALYEAVVAYGVRGPLVEDLARHGVRTTELPSLGRDIVLTADVASFFQIFALLRKERPNVVHLNSSKAAAIGALASRLCGVRKIIFTVHGWPFKEPRSALWRAFTYFVSWTTAILSDAVICVSDDDLARAKRMLFVNHKAVRIHNGIDPDMRFGSGDVIRKAFPAGVKITGTIGELTRNKNQVSLIEEARQNPNMYVAIVGEGEDRQMLEKKIIQYGLHERVKLFGYLPVADVLKGFDTFALPSLKEGLPYVLLEAKLASLPIEANRVGGVGEILDNPLSEFALSSMIERTIALY
jgi:glycosyltransferase involved in cell wall biosynthesis